jgi:hypothetical protein
MTENHARLLICGLVPVCFLTFSLAALAHALVNRAYVGVAKRAERWQTVEAHIDRMLRTSAQLASTIVRPPEESTQLEAPPAPEVPLGSKREDCNEATNRCSRVCFELCDSTGPARLREVAECQESCRARCGDERQACYARNGCTEYAPCVLDGRCKPVASRCEVGSDADCRISITCTDNGRCTAANGSCVAASDSDCLSSTQCKANGLCTARNGACEIAGAPRNIGAEDGAHR